MNILIAVFSPAPAWTLPRRFVNVLRREFPHHTFHDAWDAEALRALLPDADVAFSAAIDRSAFRSMTRLKWVQSPATGVGGMLGPELIASPIAVTSARGIRARAIAEHVMGVTLALARLLPLVVRRQTEHVWALEEVESSGSVRTLHGRRIAIVGLGAIGLEVARLAAAFGIHVSAVRRRTDLPVPPSVEEVLPPDRLHELLGRSDVVLLSAPLTAETTRLIDRFALDRIKHGALLISTTRRSSMPFAMGASGARRSMFSPESHSTRPVRTGIFRTSSSRRISRARWRTTGRRSWDCSPKICGDSSEANRC
jgi:phosphoglycerate dehydrogenase-like enzyme